MRIKLVDGKKHPKDKILLLYSDGEAITFKALLRIIQLLYENEDRIYPPSKGYKGRKKLYEAITDLTNGFDIPDILRRHDICQ